jgi:hypothetical protein
MFLSEHTVYQAVSTFKNQKLKDEKFQMPVLKVT